MIGNSHFGVHEYSFMAHGHAHLSIQLLGLLLCYQVALSSHDRDWPSKPKICNIWSFTEKACRALL